MQFIVTDRLSIEGGILVRSSYIVISIHDPDKRRARIPKQAGLRDVLVLAFHDAEPASNMKLPEDIRLMTAEQAERIWVFFHTHVGAVGAVVVHCEQGMSRSPAVAAALCRLHGGDEMYFFKNYQPNRYIYELILSEADKRQQTGKS